MEGMTTPPYLFQFTYPLSVVKFEVTGREAIASTDYIVDNLNHTVVFNDESSLIKLYR